LACFQAFLHEHSFRVFTTFLVRFLAGLSDLTHTASHAISVTEPVVFSRLTRE